MYTLPNYEVLNTILLIEDNLGDARLVEILLSDSDLNCEIINKPSLFSAFQILEEREFSVVLLDLTLPDSKGFVTLERLLQNFPNLNVIVLTGLAAKELGIKAVKAGAQDFLVKGEFNAEQLTKSLRYSIERKNVLSRLEQAQRIAHIGNWKFNPSSSQFFETSDEIYRIYGYEPGEKKLSFELFKSHVVKSDWPLLLSMFKEIAATKATVQRDIRIIRIDKSMRYLSISCQEAKGEDGTLYYNGISQDITERKEAELAFLKSQELYHSVFNQTKDAIYISNKVGKLIDFNQATANLLGYTEEELKEIDINSTFKYEKDRAAFMSAMQNHSFTKDFEAALLTKAGKTIYCLISANKTETDGFEGYHSIIRDITERKQTEELLKAKAVAEQSAKMKEQFLANISHEMRTPMNAILGMSNLVLQSTLDEEQRDYLNSIKQSSKNLLAIINDILEVSSIEHGNISFEAKRFDLHCLLRELVVVINYKAIEQGLKVELSISEEVEQYFIGDALRLNQILMNLLGNAVKFTEKGGVKIIVLKLEENDKKAKLQFQIEDTGIGIPSDKLDAIFETFVRVKSKNNKLYQGTGLGLAISKQLVHLQGGTINVISEEDKGSIFTVELAFDKTAQKVTATNIEEPIIERIILKTDKQVEILLVEDHKLNQIVARRTLEKEFQNVRVSIAENGQIAVDMLSEKDFDLVLMDIQMPVMNGYEATAYIRSNFAEPKRSIPIFAMTAHAHMAKDQKFKEYGMDDCVLKPFEPDDLFRKIAQYINKTTDLNHQTDMESNNITPKYIDLSYLELMSDGDAEMKKLMLELLFEEPLEEIKKMQRLQLEGNWEELSSVSHKMKSTLAFVGNDTLTEVNKKIEQSAKEVIDLDKLPLLLTTLEELFHKALAELKKEHAKL